MEHIWLITKIRWISFLILPEIIENMFGSHYFILRMHVIVTKGNLLQPHQNLVYMHVHPHNGGGLEDGS